MSIRTSTLLFACVDEADVPVIENEGLRSRDAADLVLHCDLADLERSCTGVILAIDAPSLTIEVGEKQKEVRVREVPGECILNVRPYSAPRTMAAAGGYVTRRRDGSPELLMIFRRGEWDLPKGKVDRGETIRAAAVREVREELGISRVDIRRPLGCTVHGYSHKARYVVKTTHWFEMHAGDEDFRPQQEEGIEAVEWVPWTEAIDRLGYESLRLHTRRVAHLLP